MLLLKRIFTSLVIFLILVWILYYGAIVVTCFFAGMIGALHSSGAADKQEVGRQAASQFFEQHAAVVAGSAIGIALVASVALCFCGVLPWCRKHSDSNL